ncbi:MAG: potassium channel family protein [Acetobacteraceae bacterium]|nr:potassium channel family protein [Acetobacteraceae bacterium]
MLPSTDAPRLVKTPAARRRRRDARLDRYWLRSVIFTVGLVGLVAMAVGADWSVTIGAIAACSLGFGFFYLIFPGGAHFGMTVANFLAIYACLFEFFRTANFDRVSRTTTLIALALPVLAFLAGCFLHRRQVFGIIHARRIRELEHLPRLTRWFLGMLLIGAASFALPRFDLGPFALGITLLASMVGIAALVLLSVRDIVLVMMDIAMVFEGVTARLDRLVMPLMAFLTFYSLIVVVFACLFRIADLTATVPQFAVHGGAVRIGFNDALYYSVATITTLGFGDIAPLSMLVRALTGIEVVSGVLMLLFGFSEIMRSAGPDSRLRAGPRRQTPSPQLPREQLPRPPSPP